MFLLMTSIYDFHRWKRKWRKKLYRDCCVWFFRNFQVWQKYIFKEELVSADGTKNYCCKNVVSQIYNFLRAKAKFFSCWSFLQWSIFGEMLKNFAVVIFMEVNFSSILLFFPGFIGSLILWLNIFSVPAPKKKLRFDEKFGRPQNFSLG